MEDCLNLSSNTSFTLVESVFDEGKRGVTELYLKDNVTGPIDSMETPLLSPKPTLNEKLVLD